MLATFQAWVDQLGGLGLYVIAVLDSSFLSLPEVNDVLVIYLSMRHPEWMPYYASMTTLGSLTGCFLLYGMGRKGGEVFLRRRFNSARVDRGIRLYQRWGLIAVIVPSLLPPPTPFKIFVLMAGAAAVAPWRFALAVILGRGTRYFGQAYLAVRYGERGLELVRQHRVTIAVVLAAITLAAGAGYLAIRRQRPNPSLAGNSSGSNGR
ncbi:MAG: DedA family protein [Acidobacteria bacterium]|nr:DedA family protein [Acidobacteriota bacterium]